MESQRRAFGRYHTSSYTVNFLHYEFVCVHISAEVLVIPGSRVVIGDLDLSHKVVYLVTELVSYTFVECNLLLEMLNSEVGLLGNAIDTVVLQDAFLFDAIHPLVDVVEQS